MSNLSISNLKIWTEKGSETRELVHGIDLNIPQGKVTGLAGESGSGKTLTGLCLLGLLPEGLKHSGSIEFDGENIASISPKRMTTLRGSRIAMVFQDPTASLHPMITIGAQLTDHLRKHAGISKKEAYQKAFATLERVRVPNPESALKRYPHQFSGGQLQRIAIALAIICEPDVLIADEPTTALDVTVQAQILHLLRFLCDEMNLGILLVTHDLGVMSALADTIAVMRQGNIVEHGDRFQIITQPQDEYTRLLISSLPQVDHGVLGS